MKQTSRGEPGLKEWQFLLLRFAITRDPIDQAAAFAAAKPLDEAVPRHTPTFSYFSRTTSQVCAAITGTRDEQARLALRNFLARIEDERLKGAFSACLDLQAPTHASRRAAWRDKSDLWRGLAKR